MACESVDDHGSRSQGTHSGQAFQPRSVRLKLAKAGQPLPRSASVRSRQASERPVELFASTEAWTGAAEVDDSFANGQRRHELGTLLWRCFLRHCSKAL